MINKIPSFILIKIAKIMKNNILKNKNLLVITQIMFLFNLIPMKWVNNTDIFLIFAYKRDMLYIKNVFYKNNDKISDILSFPIDFESFKPISNIIIYINIIKTDNFTEYAKIPCLHGFLHSLNFKHNTKIDFDIMLFLQNYLIMSNDH